MIVTPGSVYQMNVEVYQDQINARHGTKFNMSVAGYSIPMAVAYGRSGKDGQVISAKQLEAIAGK